MNKVTCSVNALLSPQLKADLYVHFYEQDEKGHSFNELASYVPCLFDLIDKKESHDGSNFELFAPGSRFHESVHCVFFGASSFKQLPSLEARERVRVWMGKIIRYAERNHLHTIALSVPSHPDVAKAIFIEDMATIAPIAHYRFDEFITNGQRKTIKNISLIFTDIAKTELTKIEKVLEKAHAVSFAVNTSRYWADLPPSLLNPPVFADEVYKLLSPHSSLSVKVFEKKELEELKMGGILNVCRGSMYEPRMIVAEYKAPQKNSLTIALVGKGVTFDTGGISIKPADNMEDMKADMSGAAAVLSTMDVIARLKPDINVIACAPLVENMPSGTALKPGDIVTFYNGKTAEIKNTDAEGRLILADALSYIAKNYSVDLIIDAATLTGACSVALGPFFAGLMSQHEKHSASLAQAGLHSGDRVWELPLHNDYRKAIDSEVADICNTGKRNYRAGTITAGFFLKEFVPDSIPWIHLDIAGVAMHVPDKSYFHSVGATGFGVRLFTEFICNPSYHECLKK